MGEKSVASAGAGISRLASAIMLARQGWDVCLYEQFAELAPVGAGLMLQPTGLVALERLGLLQDVELLGHPITRLVGLSGTATVFDLRYDSLAGNYNALGIHRGALHGILWRSFHRSSAKLVTGCTIDRVKVCSDGRAHFQSEQGETLAGADLLIDASCSSSKLRRLVSRVNAKPYTYGAVWATVPDIGIGPNTLAQRYADARVMLGYLPIGKLTRDGENLAALFWSLKPTDYDAWRAGFEQWRREAIDLWPAMAPIINMLQSPNDLSLVSYAQFTPRYLARDRLVLIGDAAHSTSPQLGQGANQGLIDAVVLVDALAAEPPSQAVRSYARARKSQVRFYQYASATMTPFFQSNSRFLSTLRDLTFDRMKSIPFVHGQMLRTLTGLKTGLLSSASPDRIVNVLKESR
jgi:2-polyprenyl-6-methoxyphenol hydroxylase-like FAD-dependent oxidoreductase